jgi:isoleucyl-tRNA synthetase
MKTRPYQIVSTLHNLHVYFKQNNEFDKFDQDRHTLQWVAASNLLGPTEVWLLSKLQGLITEVTGSFERCRFHEGAKAIDEFIINHLSQTYVPLTRNIIWDDSAENLDRRLAVYSVIGHVLVQIDIMLHPLSPFTTEYLYLTCFGKKKSVLLASWPQRDEKLVNTTVESAFDTIKEIVSLANAARNLAGLKRRWPVKEVLICGPGMKSLEVEGVSDALKSQLNTGQYKLIEIAVDSQLEKVASLLERRMPVSVSVELVRKSVAPRVKADIGKVVQAFESADKLSLLNSLRSGSYSLAYDDKGVELSASDVEVSYKAAEGYSSSERDGLVVFISTTRDKDLTAKGLLRDMARQLQQLRKERQYNPTEILNAAYVASLDGEEIATLSAMKDELTYLVRVKSVEIGGREFKISVE